MASIPSWCCEYYQADTYLALGVLELWLLDFDTKGIEVRNRAAGEPAWESTRYGRGELAISQALPGWQVSVDALFAEL